MKNVFKKGKELVVSESKEIAVQKSPAELLLATKEMGISIEDLNKVLDLQVRYEELEAKKAYVSAMVEAQKAMPVIYEGRKNTQTNSSYSAYKDIIRDAKPIYTEAGLSVSFYEEETKREDYIKFCADVYHVNGHSKTFKTELPIDDKGPKGTKVKTTLHGTKSAFSYGRGILLCNIFNIPTSADVDDDGDGAGAKLIDEKQLGQIVDLINVNYVDEKKFLEWAKVGKVENLFAEHFNKYVSALQAKV